jgi:hypothetical protein
MCAAAAFSTHEREARAGSFFFFFFSFADRRALLSALLRHTSPPRYVLHRRLALPLSRRVAPLSCAPFVASRRTFVLRPLHRVVSHLCLAPPLLCLCLAPPLSRCVAPSPHVAPVVSCLRHVSPLLRREFRPAVEMEESVSGRGAGWNVSECKGKCW